jgi:hypothetical protein
MKNNILISIVCVFFLHTTASAHLENVHQYILYQAYQYLKLKTGKTIPEFEQQIALWKQNGVFKEANSDLPKFNGGLPRYWELSPALSISIWREDHQDAVWERKGLENAEISSSHFWVADLGDDALTPLGFGPLGINIGNFRNAWEKARIYAFGKNKLSGIWNNVIAIQGNYEDEFFGGLGNAGKYISYTSLIDLYKTGNYWYNGTKTEYQDGDQTISEYSKPGVFNPGDQPLSATVRKLYAYNLLGRIAHLLTDMGVPAHVHGDIHACPLADADSYEQYMGDKMKVLPCYEPYLDDFYSTRWTALSAERQGDFIFNEFEIRSQFYSDEQILRELFYTIDTIQVSLVKKVEKANLRHELPNITKASNSIPQCQRLFTSGFYCLAHSICPGVECSA